MPTYKDGHHRSIFKAISWRVIATTTTVTIVFIFSRRLELGERFALSAGVGAADMVSKLILYYFHERIWGFLGIGRKEHPLSSLRVEKPLTEEDMEEVKKKLKDLGYIEED